MHVLSFLDSSTFSHCQNLSSQWKPTRKLMCSQHRFWLIYFRWNLFFFIISCTIYRHVDPQCFKQFSQKLQSLLVFGEVRLLVDDYLLTSLVTWIMFKRFYWVVWYFLRVFSSANRISYSVSTEIDTYSMIKRGDWAIQTETLIPILTFERNNDLKRRTNWFWM